MVNRMRPYHTPKGASGASGNIDDDTIMDMCGAMDELFLHNQTLEHDAHNIRQHQQESNPPEKMQMLDPYPL